MAKESPRSFFCEMKRQDTRKYAFNPRFPRLFRSQQGENARKFNIPPRRRAVGTPLNHRDIGADRPALAIFVASPPPPHEPSYRVIDPGEYAMDC